MKTIILCGGQGTRLREMTEFIPKPMVEIGGKPILWHIMRHYAYYGYNEFILALGYKGSVIKEYFLSYLAMNNDFTINTDSNEIDVWHKKEPNLKVTLVDTGLDTTTGGRIKIASKYIGEDAKFMLTYGDGLSDVNIERLVMIHNLASEADDKLITMTVTGHKSNFGIVDVDKRNTIVGFNEKPSISAYINAGFMVMDTRAIDSISDDEYFEKEPIGRLVAENKAHAYKHNGFFQQMDTYRDYLLLTDLWNSGKAPWKIW